jgi:hypothetical protein
VSIEDDQLTGVEFCPTDVVRWYWAQVMLSENDNLPELYATVKRELEDCLEASEGRFAAVRLIITGRCAAHEALLSSASRLEVIGEIRNLANELNEEVWIEEIHFETLPPVDLEALRAGGDLLGDLLRRIELIENNQEELAALGTRLAVLEQNRPEILQQAGINIKDTRRIKTWLGQAEGLLVGHLLSGESHETA